MITEYGSVISTKATAGEARGKLIKKLNWLWILMLVIGAAGLVAYVVLGTVIEETYGYEPKWLEVVLVISAFPFAIGLVLTLTVRSQRKAEAKSNDVETYSEFFSDCVILREFKGEEQVGIIRILYTEILYVKQRGDFLFPTVAQGIAYPVCVRGMEEKELNTIKNKLRLPIEGGAELIELKECNFVN